MKYIFFVYILLFSIVVESNVAERVKLDVPVIKQGRALCGPATIEMVFRYWGVTDYDQYDIAYNILMFNPQSKRVVKSKILENNQVETAIGLPKMNWNEIPLSKNRMKKSMTPGINTDFLKSMFFILSMIYFHRLTSSV